MLADGIDGADEPLIRCRHKTQLREQQQSGIQAVTAEGRHEGFQLRIPGFRDNPRVHGIGVLPPTRRSRVLPDAQRDIGQTIAARPAHDGRVRVDVLTTTQFPGPRIGLGETLHRVFPQSLQAGKDALRVGDVETLVVKQLGGSEDDRPVHVILFLFERLIADANRTDAAIAT